jgi:OmpA-OmpF porin, OOP family
MSRAWTLAALTALGIAGAMPNAGFSQELPAALDPGAPEGAALTIRTDLPFDRYALPVGPYAPDTANARDIEGRVIWSGFRLDAGDISTAEVIEGYRTRLTALGYQPVFSCDTATCGGFDFRFSIQLLPPPDMLLDTADFAQFTASRIAPSAAGNQTETFVSVLVSRLLGAIHIQTVVVAAAIPGVTIAPAPEAGAAVQPETLIQDERSLLDRLNKFGHVPVQGLAFESGGSALAEGSAPALDILARLLSRNTDLLVAIVGHSDNQGILDANIDLSKLRAEAVRDALIDRGVAADQLDAYGVGYLAPVTTNATEAGRALNRRVELVLR